jgi:hypothetical protein
MKLGTVAKSAAFVIASQLLLACGTGTSSSTTSTVPSPDALTGNWNLLGDRALQQYPLLSLSLIVNGDQITAQGDSNVMCPNGDGGGGTVGLSGQIAADGTFALNESAGNQSSFLWAITGTAPPTGSSTWTGSYTLTTSPTYMGCTINQTAAFTATALPPFNGTYAGTLVEGLTASPTATATVTLDVSQGAAVVSLPPGLSYLPLSGSIMIAGSPCFTHGTSITTPGGDIIKGDYLAMAFAMDDGSQAVLSAFCASPDETTLTGVLFSSITGQCAQTVYGGTLTRQ